MSVCYMLTLAPLVTSIPASPVTWCQNPTAYKSSQRSRPFLSGWWEKWRKETNCEIVVISHFKKMELLNKTFQESHYFHSCIHSWNCMWNVCYVAFQGSPTPFREEFGFGRLWVSEKVKKASVEFKMRTKSLKCYKPTNYLIFCVYLSPITVLHFKNECILKFIFQLFRVTFWHV